MGFHHSLSEIHVSGENNLKFVSGRLKRFTFVSPFTPYHQDDYSPYCSLNISYADGRENLFYDQELLQLVVISFLLMTLMFDSGIIM